MKKILILIIIILLAVFFLNRNSDVDDVVTENSNNESNQVESVDNQDSENDVEQAESADLAAGTYEDYSEEKLSMHSDKDIVLFFKADWCPSCRALDSDIKASLNDIPEDVAILQVNYDTATELKKKYGITTQHSFVQVDSSGNLIKKWSGGNNLEVVVSQIN